MHQPRDPKIRPAGARVVRWICPFRQGLSVGNTAPFAPQPGRIGSLPRLHHDLPRQADDQRGDDVELCPIGHMPSASESIGVASWHSTR
jgi:hypothetical protein